MSTQDDNEIFADMDFLSTWSDEERQNLMAAVKGHIRNRSADEKAVEFVDWGEIEGGFETHDDADCNTEFKGDRLVRNFFFRARVKGDFLTCTQNVLCTRGGRFFGLCAKFPCARGGRSALYAKFSVCAWWEIGLYANFLLVRVEGGSP